MTMKIVVMRRTLMRRRKQMKRRALTRGIYIYMEKNVKSNEQNNISTTPSTTPQVRYIDILSRRIQYLLVSNIKFLFVCSHIMEVLIVCQMTKKCKLLNWKKWKEILAIGRQVTNDPKTVVHGKALEKISQVWVDLILQPKAPIYRPCFGNETIEEIQGSATTWLTKHIMMLDEQVGVKVNTFWMWIEATSKLGLATRLVRFFIVNQSWILSETFLCFLSFINLIFF